MTRGSGPALQAAPSAFPSAQSVPSTHASLTCWSSDWMLQMPESVLRAGVPWCGEVASHTPPQEPARPHQRSGDPSWRGISGHLQEFHPLSGLAWVTTWCHLLPQQVRSPGLGINSVAPSKDEGEPVRPLPLLVAARVLVGPWFVHGLGPCARVALSLVPRCHQPSWVGAPLFR